MTYADTDPLPGLPFVRVYNENERATGDGFFGPGWNTLLDAWYTPFDEPYGRGTVVVELGDDVTRVFRLINSVQYVKVWPLDGGTSEDLAFDGTYFTYRDLRTGRDYKFGDIWDRRLASVKELATGREIRITRNYGHTPIRVEDSWGNWAWNLTVNSQNSISRVELEGDPSVAWTYTYGAGNDRRLMSVQGPGGAPWRTYSYASVPGGWAISEVRDGAGRVIESHSYSGHRATSSLGHENEVTNTRALTTRRRSDEGASRTPNGGKTFWTS